MPSQLPKKVSVTALNHVGKRGENSGTRRSKKRQVTTGPLVQTKSGIKKINGKLLLPAAGVGKRRRFWQRWAYTDKTLQTRHSGRRERSASASSVDGPLCRNTAEELAWT